MEELAPISVLDVVMALQRQGAIGQYKSSRYISSLLQSVSFVTLKTRASRALSHSSAPKHHPHTLSAIVSDTFIKICSITQSLRQCRQTLTCSVLHKPPASALLVPPEALPPVVVLHLQAA